MAMQTDVKGLSCAAGAATTAYNGRTRFKSLWYSASTTGTITISDGATTLFTFTFLAGNTNNVLIPGEGVLCTTSLIVTTSSGIDAVVFYG